MEIFNLQTGVRLWGDIREWHTAHENITGDFRSPIYRWVTTIQLNNGFELRLLEDEIQKFHPHTHAEIRGTSDEV